MTLYFDHAGPMMRYAHGMLEISDLNPEGDRRWRMSRWEMYLLGLRCLLAATKVTR